MQTVNEWCYAVLQYSVITALESKLQAVMLPGVCCNSLMYTIHTFMNEAGYSLCNRITVLRICFFTILNPE
jgi:hypothetical protein